MFNELLPLRSIQYGTAESNTFCSKGPNLFAKKLLLSNPTSGGEHGKTAIVQLFVLKLLERFRIFGFETKGIPTIVTWHYVSWQREAIGVILRNSSLVRPSPFLDEK